MKNVVHAIGGSDPYLQAVIYGYMNVAKDIIEDTLMGANVSSFSKNSALSVQQINSAQLQALFSNGLNLVSPAGNPLPRPPARGAGSCPRRARRPTQSRSARRSGGTGPARACGSRNRPRACAGR